MIVTCARCGHVAGAMCPHCGRKDNVLGGRIYEDQYCHTYVEKPTCYERQQDDEMLVDADQISYLSVPMTPEEEEMLSADLGIDTQDTA